MADDIEQFIADQKNRLARERLELQQQNTEKLYRDVQNGGENHEDHHEKRLYEPTAHQREVERDRNKGGLPVYGQTDSKQQLRRERQAEYARFLKEKEARAGQNRTVPGGDGRSLPIGERASEKSQVENQRKLEYQAYLKETEARERRKREERMGYTTRDQAVNGRSMSPKRDVDRTFRNNPVRKEAASQTPAPPPVYDDSRPPRPPRRGWGSPGPDYEDMLHRRREEEARYRRYDDLDYYPVRMSLKPSTSDPRLDRHSQEDGRYSRVRDSEDRRRVRFTDLEKPEREQTYVSDRLRHSPRYDNAEDGYGRDHYGVTRSNTLPDMDRSAPVPKPSPRAKSATSTKEEGGFIIGSRETNSAIQRRKEMYRKELAQQIQEQKEAKKRERRQELQMISQNAPEPTSTGRGSVAQAQPPQPGTIPPPVQAYAPSFTNQAHSTQRARVPEYPSHYGVAGAVPPMNPMAGPIQPPVPSLGLTDAHSRPLPPPEPVGSLGLDEAYLRSGMTMLDQPFNITSNTADPYSYYKLRNPMEPDPNYSGRQLALNQPTNPSLIPPSQQVPLNVSGVSTNQTLQPTVQYNQVVNTSGLRSESAIRNYVGDSGLSPRALKDPKSYQQQLLSQMKEKEMKKLQERQERARYEAKLEAEAHVYNPWGKGGGGAPMRNAQGQVFADLKQLHQINEQVLQDPGKSVPLYADAPGQAAPTATAAAPTGLARAMTERGMNPAPPDTLTGGPGGPETTSTQGTPTDVYKAQLMQQVDEKRRREAEEKEKIRLEEEKEERRLAVQREKMQQEFEMELENKKKKEEEKQRQQQELEAKIEEKKREAEERKRVARKRVEQPVATVTEDQTVSKRQVLSPPVPTLAKNKENLERLKSPPIPTLQKKMADRSLQQRNRTPQQSPRQTPQQTPRQTPRETSKQTSRRQSQDDRVRSSRQHSDPARDENKMASPLIREGSRATSLGEEKIFSPRDTTVVHTSNDDTSRITRIGPPLGPVTHAGAYQSGVHMTVSHTPDAVSEFLVERDEPREDKTTTPERPRLLTPLERLRRRYFKEGSGAESSSRPHRTRESDLVDWLRALDPELVIYAPSLAANGYRSTQTLRRLTRHSLLDTCPGMKRGHVDAIIHEVERIQTPNTLGQRTDLGGEITPDIGPYFDDESVLDDLEFSDEEIPDTTRSVSPPVPAVSNRERDGGERDVISALSAMRRQLQSEQRRIQGQLDKHQDYGRDAHTKPPTVVRRASPQVDIFEVARHKGGGVSVRREPINYQAADDFKHLRGGRSQSREKLLEQFPAEPHSNLALEAQQRALLKHQQSRLHEMKQDSNMKGNYLADLDALGRASQSPAVPLESSSAFIGIESGETREAPKEIYDFDVKESPGPSKPTDPFGSVTSFDSAMLERLTQKNKARNELLKALEPDTDSLGDADDILNQFLAKQSIDSPAFRSASRRSEDLSLWLKPSEG